MGRKNTASGNDVVAVQAGTTKRADKAPKQDREKTGPAVNVRKGNARVGVQTDTITGGLHF